VLKIAFGRGASDALSKVCIYVESYLFVSLLLLALLLIFITLSVSTGLVVMDDPRKELKFKLIKSGSVVRLSIDIHGELIPLLFCV